MRLILNRFYNTFKTTCNDEFDEQKFLVFLWMQLYNRFSQKSPREAR